MKKLLLIVLLVLGLGLYAQNKTVFTLDGNDWIQWNTDEKTLFVAGFMASEESTLFYLLTKGEPDGMTDDEKLQYEARMKDQFGFETSTTDIIAKVDVQYNLSESQLIFPIWKCILFVFNKDFTEIKPVDPTSYLGPVIQRLE